MTHHRTIALSLVVLLVAGCTEPPAPDYRQTYPIEVRTHNEAMNLHVAPDGRFAAGEEALFATHVAAYLDRGHGPITVAARMSAASDSDVDLQAVHARLLAAGVPANAIRLLLVADAPRDGVTLSFDRYIASVPGCGDWSGTTGWNPYNQVHSNFGCANQRNIGAMAADPADLVRMRDPAPTDAQSANRVIRLYREGQPTGAVSNPLQSSNTTATTSR